MEFEILRLDVRIPSDTLNDGDAVVACGCEQDRDDWFVLSDIGNPGTWTPWDVDGNKVDLPLTKQLPPDIFK